MPRAAACHSALLGKALAGVAARRRSNEVVDAPRRNHTRQRQGKDVLAAAAVELALRIGVVDAIDPDLDGSVKTVWRQVPALLDQPDAGGVGDLPQAGFEPVDAARARTPPSLRDTEASAGTGAASNPRVTVRDSPNRFIGFLPFDQGVPRNTFEMLDRFDGSHLEIRERTDPGWNRLRSSSVSRCRAR